MAGGLARLEAIWRSPCFSPGHPAGRVVSESAWVGFEGYVPTTCWPQSPCCGWPPGELERQLYQSCSLRGGSGTRCHVSWGHRRPSQVLALHLLPGPLVQLAGSVLIPDSQWEVVPQEGQCMGQLPAHGTDCRKGATETYPMRSDS